MLYKIHCLMGVFVLSLGRGCVIILVLGDFIVAKTYDAKDIKVLEGLDAVRMRPGMYIGTTGPRGLHHLLWEIVDNAVDEAANGYCSSISVTLHKDGSASVEDGGRGVPTDMHPTLKKSGVEVVFTQLHAGGKFDSSNYNYSGGLHGVGASVVNALSRWLVVDVWRNGKHYQQKFSSRIVKGKTVSGGVPEGKLEELETTKKHGTRVQFLPDDRCFETIEWSDDTIVRRLREMAFLNKNLEIVFVDERAGEPITKTFCYSGGLSDFVKYINESKTVLYEKPIVFEGEKDGVVLDVAMQHTDQYTSSLYSFVNNINTPDGGTHEIGFKSGITRVLNNLARKTGALKDKDQNLLGDDFQEGLTAVVSVHIKNAQFEGQTKARLGNPEVKVAVEQMVVQLLTAYFEGRGTGKVADTILDKAVSAAKVREATRKAKETARAKNSLENANLIGKLAACTGKKPEENELFIVEGDSAGGTAKQGRDRHFQAILPLRGKPLNAEKKRIDQVLLNEEIRTLVSALGAGIGEDFNLEKLKYHKVIILADADQDGAHIRAILLTFFFRYMRDLVTHGHVFIGLPPLYRIEKRGQKEYVFSDAELPEAVERFGKNYTLQRYKGLGEMDPEQLRFTTMDPKERNLVQVTIEDAAEADKIITTLMGDNVEARKAYIMEHSDFNKIDQFEKKGEDDDA